MRIMLTLAVLCLTAVAWADCRVSVASPEGGTHRPCTLQEEADFNARDAEWAAKAQERADAAAQEQKRRNALEALINREVLKPPAGGAP
jgi:uncharacterized protein YfaP (DUF2135 family)